MRIRTWHFEFQSMIGELVAMDAVTLFTYDWANASGDASRMASLATGRREILVAGTTSPEKRSIMGAYCGSLAEMRLVGRDPETGQVSLEDLKQKI